MAWPFSLVIRLGAGDPDRKQKHARGDKWKHVGIIALLLVLLPALAHAQAVRYDNASYTVSGTAPLGSFIPILAVPGATVAVCQDSLCAQRATTYTSAAASSTCGTQAQLTPAAGGVCTSSTDNQGNFGFWVLPGSYYYQITLPSRAGGGVSGPFPVNIGATTGCPSGITCDTNYSTLVAADSAAGSGTLGVTKNWNSQTTEPLSSHLQFYSGGGKIQTASGQTVTLANCPQAGPFQIFDTSTGGHVAIPASCAAPVQWWGVKGDGATDNHLAFNEALAYAGILQVPPGNYQTSTFLRSALNGQQILCTGGSQGANPSIITFTGATHGIIIGNGVALAGNVVSGCQIVQTNAGGNGCIVVDYNSGDLKTDFTITNNFCTTSGAGKWLSAFRIVAGETGTLSYNRAYGEIAIGIAAGQGAVSSTHLRFVHNLIGALEASGAGQAFLAQGCQDCSVEQDYYQGAFTGNIIEVDAASIVHFTDVAMDNPSGTATAGAYCNGVCVFKSPFLNGLYAEVFHSQAGTMMIDSPFGAVSASTALVTFHSVTGGSILSNCSGLLGFKNTHATGLGVSISASPNNVISNCPITTIGGDLVSITGGSTGAVIEKSALTTSSGHGISTDGANNTFSFQNNTFAGMTLANVCSHCYNSATSAVLSATANWLTGTGYIPDILYAGATVVIGAGANQTITPTGKVMAWTTGTGSIQTINMPWSGFSGCIHVIPNAAWTLVTGGNILVASTAVPYKAMTLCTSEVFSGSWAPSY